MHFDVHRSTLDGRCQNYHNHSLGHLEKAHVMELASTNKYERLFKSFLDKYSS